MEVKISNTKEISDNLLSLDGIEIEETGTGKCLTLEGIINENESSEQLQKFVDDGEFELNIEDGTNQLDIKNNDETSKTNLNEDVNLSSGKSDVLQIITDNDDEHKHLSEMDKVPVTDTPSAQNFNTQIGGEVEKNIVITEQEDFIQSNSNYSNGVEDTVKLDINKDHTHEEDEQEEALLENILQKNKNDHSDSSDSEFDFELPEKSKEPQRHIKSSDTSVQPKTVVSVSDIDFAFSSLVEEQSVRKNSNEFKVENRSAKITTDFENSVSKDTPDELDKNRLEKITVTTDKSIKVSKEEGQGQDLSNVEVSPKRKRAPDIPTSSILNQDRNDRKTEINEDKKVIAANGNVAINTEGEQETVASNVALRHAMDEWDNVQTIEAGFSDSKSGAQGSVPKIVQAMPLLSFHEMFDYFKTCDFSSVKPNIQTHIERHGFAALKNFLFGPPKLHRDLMSDREKVFCVAGSSLDNTNNIHLRSLQTIYRTLTGSRFDCGRYGNHWEEIGFQGNDPSTDLRGAGMLGLTNLIYFLSDPRKKPLAQDIYKLSLHPTQNFPFCVVGINISRITLQSLREDLLNKECNKRKDVFEVVNDFYVGLYLQLYQVWKFQGKTIADSGNVIKHIETTAKKSPHHVFKNLEEYLSKKKTGKSTSAVDLESMDFGKDNFLGVCETEAGQY